MKRFVQICRGNQNTYFEFNNFFFFENRAFMRQCGKIL